MNNKLVGGKYEILSELGRGGMGVVYKAEQSALGRTVAVKALSHELAENEQFLGRFKQEARVVARMGSHDNIVQVYDVEAHEGDYFIIMEFVEGHSLGQKIKAGKKPNKEESIRIVRQVAKALQHAHEQGIVHRDIKPDNVMLTKTGKVKVMDFGIARSADSDVKTQTGMSIGTPHYMSPEQIEGRKDLDARSDLYSLGVMLYYLMVGRLPFDEDNPFSLAMKHISEPPPPPSVINPEVDSAMEAIILKSMAKNPADRYQTAAEFESDLRAYQHAGRLVGQTGDMPAADDSFLDLTDKARQALAAKARTLGMAPPTKPEADYEATVAMSGSDMADYPTPAPQPQDAKTVHDPGAARRHSKPAPKKGLSWAMLAVIGAAVALVGGVGGYLIAPKQVDGLLASAGVTLPGGVRSLAYGLHGEKPDGGTSPEAPTVDGRPTPAPSIPTPTPTPSVFEGDPEDSVLTDLRGRFSRAAYNQTALRNFASEIKTLSEKYPRSDALRQLSTDVAVRQGKAEIYQRTADRVRDFLADGEFEAARRELATNAPSFDISGAERDLQSAIDSAVSGYVTETAGRIKAALDRKEVATAKRLVEEAQRKLPDNKTWDEYEGRILDLELEMQAEDLQRKEADDLQTSFATALQEGEYDRARGMIEEMRQRYPDRLDPREAERLLKSYIDREVNRIAREAIQATARDELENAIALYDRALALDPSNLDLLQERTKLQKSLQTQNRGAALLIEARDYLAQRNYSEAMLKVNEALVINPLDTTARALQEEIRRLQSETQQSAQAGQPRITDSPEVIARRTRNAPRDMVYVPGGYYPIGTDEGPSESRPRHVVRIDGFYIGQFEVSVEEYDEFLRQAASGKRRPSLVSGTAFDRPQYPIVGVSYLDARDYAEWRRGRLPTEFEWEAAARTIDGYKYPIGNRFEASKGNTGDSGRIDGHAQVAPVRSSFDDGTKNSGYPDGIRSTYNMMGNVSEWTDSMFQPYPGNNTSHSLFNKSQYRVVRGGSHSNSSPSAFEAWRREPVRESTRSRNDIGIRIVMDPQ